MKRNEKMFKRRMDKKLTHYDLRDIAGVSRPTISKIESGDIEFVKVNTLRKIAKALDYTVAELFFSEEQ